MEQDHPTKGNGTTPYLSRLADADTRRAAALGAAVIATNLLAVVWTIVFARLLGAEGYGSLGALLSAFLILAVPGQALQVTVAREVSHAVAGDDSAPGAGVHRWLQHLVVGTIVATVCSILLRDVIAAMIGVDEEWAAAAVIPSACLWLILSVQRGALQGFGRYRWVGASLVAEAAARLAVGLIMIVAGLDVAGAFLGTGLGVLIVALVLELPLRPLTRIHRHHARPLRELVRRAWAPLVALALLAWLQNLDIIVVKHQASDAAAGAWAGAAVAGKAMIWVAVGLALYLVPETAKRARWGDDARPILARTLGLIALVGIPMVLIYAAAGELVLRLVFKEKEFELASSALPWLGAAMTLLAFGFLCVQYLLALQRWRFIAVLGLAALAEPLLLLLVGSELLDIALALLALEVVLAAALLTIAARSAPGPVETPVAVPEPAPTRLAG